MFGSSELRFKTPPALRAAGLLETAAADSLPRVSDNRERDYCKWAGTKISCTVILCTKRESGFLSHESVGISIPADRAARSYD